MSFRDDNKTNKMIYSAITLLFYPSLLNLLLLSSTNSIFKFAIFFLQLIEWKWDTIFGENKVWQSIKPVRNTFLSFLLRLRLI